MVDLPNPLSKQELFMEVPQAAYERIWHHRQCATCGSLGALGALDPSWLACSGCAESFHYYCVELLLPMPPELAKGWRCASCNLCSACRTSENEDALLLCSHCDRAFHIYCLSPPLLQIPDDDWLCLSCDPPPDYAALALRI